MKHICFQCKNKGTLYHGYAICETCKGKLRLLTDKTIKKHASSYGLSCYKDKVNTMLEIGEKEYIQGKIKLLHIKERLDQIATKT